MENAAVWRTESRMVYSIRIRQLYTLEDGQMGLWMDAFKARCSTRLTFSGSIS